MKKGVIVFIAIFLTLFFVFLTHDVVKEHMTFMEAYSECLIGSSIFSIVLFVIGIIVIKRKK